MNELEQKKFNTLKNILKSYDNYSGTRERYEKRLHKLENKLKQKSFDKLVGILEMFADYVCEVLAKTKRVFVKIDKDSQTLDNDEIDEMFKEFEDVE